MASKHPFLLGTGVGALGLFVWLKRGWFLAKFHNLAAKLHGAGILDLPVTPDVAPIVIRQIRRYAFAASQDKSPIVGLTHASYALILLDTAEEMLGRDAVARLSGVPPTKMRQIIAAVQDAHAERLQECDPYMKAVRDFEKNAGSQFLLDGFGSAPRGA